MLKQYTFKDLVFKNIGEAVEGRRYRARLEFDNNYAITVAPEFTNGSAYELAIWGFNDFIGEYDFLGDLKGDVFRHKDKKELQILINVIAKFANYALSDALGSQH